MPNRRRRTPSSIDDDFSEEDDTPEITAQPRQRSDEEDDGDRLVPLENVGGAAPTTRGLDSGGDLPGSEDDLSNLAEPEPPEDAPEIGAMRVRRGDPSRS